MSGSCKAERSAREHTLTTSLDTEYSTDTSDLALALTVFSLLWIVDEWASERVKQRVEPETEE